MLLRLILVGLALAALTLGRNSPSIAFGAELVSTHGSGRQSEPSTTSGAATAPQTPQSTNDQSSTPAPAATTPSKPGCSSKSKPGKGNKKPNVDTGGAKTDDTPKEGKSDTPPKKVVRNGSTTEPTTKLTPDVPDQQANAQIKVTEQMLNDTEANLKRASERNLSTDQTAMAEQVRKYVEQSRTASKTGDVERAFGFAKKARLLSEELVPR